MYPTLLCALPWQCARPAAPARAQVCVKNPGKDTDGGYCTGRPKSSDMLIGEWYSPSAPVSENPSAGAEGLQPGSKFVCGCISK